MKLTSSPVISAISGYYPQYGKTGMFKQRAMVLIEIKKDVFGQKANLLSVLNKNADGFTFSDSYLYGPYILESKDIEKFRNVVDHLYKNNTIDNSDRSDVEGEVRDIERMISLNKKNADKISDIQSDIIKYMCEEHIDFLMKTLKSLDGINNFIDDFLGFLNYFPGSYQGCVFQDWLIKKGKFERKELDELIESFKYLGKIYQGVVNLEETFVKQGSNLPAIEKQQDVIKELILSKVSGAFQNGMSTGNSN